jgi:hypothetical protein
VGVSQTVYFLANCLSSFYFAHFYRKTLIPLAYKKQTLPLVGWSKKYLRVKFCDFLTPTNAVIENPQALRNITNPTGWDGVKKYYSHQLCLKGQCHEIFYFCFFS